MLFQGQMKNYMDSERLYEVIYATLFAEDKDLTQLTDKGIFYAPELYIAFILGKNIKKNEHSIFNEKVNWVRETNLGNTGPTDFAFQVDRLTYAFELKLRDTVHSYKSDIEKLKLLKNGFRKFFIALVDSWETEKEKDLRILSLEKQYPELKRANNFLSFHTEQDRYKKQACCTVCVWEI